MAITPIRSAQRRWSDWRPRRFGDWLPAVALAAAGLLELSLQDAADPDFRAPRAVDAAFLLLISLPLAWRRRAPLAVLAVVGTAVVVRLNAFYNSAPQPPIEPFLALLVAIYTAAAHSDGLRARVAGAVALAVAFGDVPALVAGRRWGDTLPAWLFYAIAWAVGRVLHRRQRLVFTLTDRTVELEREREERARLAAIDERARIARELHDVIAHNVSVMVLQASVERRVLAPEQQSTRDTLGSIEHTGRQALVELRRLLGVMRKAGDGPTLAPQPSLDQLDALVEQVSQAGLPVELRVEGEPRAIAPGVDVSAYRIVQEALTNVVKHAGPARAEVLVRYAASEVELVVCDDGHGSSAADGGGHGLAGIRERVALYGGDPQAGPRSGGGYELRARLPDAPAGR